MEEPADNTSTAKNSLPVNTGREIHALLDIVVGLSEQSLDCENLPPKVMGNLEKIHASGTELLNILNDLPDLTRIESGKFELATDKPPHNIKLTRIPMPEARVLVVDDVQTNLDIARGVMKPYQMTIDCVLSGIEAVNLVRKAEVKYDAIFMDYTMPELDGIEATRMIREEIGSDYAKTVPVIALTANANITQIDNNENLLSESGFQAFLSKPIDIMKLDAILRQWVRKQSPGLDAETKGRPSANEAEKADETPASGRAAKNTQAPGIHGIDRQAGLARFGGNEEVYLSVIRSFKVSTAHLIEKIRSVSPETFADYAIIIHSIKGSSYGVEAHEIGKKAEELEHAAKRGDFQFVLDNNAAFIKTTEKLLADLATLTDASATKVDETARLRAPDDALLIRMEEAAANFRIDILEEIMRSLERFKYETETELIAWLQKNVNRMDFSAIQERLKQRRLKSPGNRNV
jgi:CheY-like chemotaxis protein